jgi:hypothetical protein
VLREARLAHRTPGYSSTSFPRARRASPSISRASTVKIRSRSATRGATLATRAARPDSTRRSAASRGRAPSSTSLRISQRRRSRRTLRVASASVLRRSAATAE